MGLVPGGPFHKTFLCPELIPEDSELVCVCHFHPSLIFAGKCGLVVNVKRIIGQLLTTPVNIKLA